MTVRNILRMGNPLLLQPSQPIQTFNTPELDALINDLKDTMYHANGAGLAAPQIGVLLQVVIFGSKSSSSNPRYPDENHIEEQVLINPVITPNFFEEYDESNNKKDDVMTDGWEGCLSVPGMRGLVPRYESINYTGYDETGAFRSVTVSGFHARVVQHECDHLWGKLYPMRMTDMSSFGFTEELSSTPHNNESDKDNGKNTEKLKE